MLDNLNAILKAKKFIINIRDENYVILDSFKKEIESNEDNKTKYSTSVYDNRIANCNTILEVLEKQLPKKPIIRNWCPAKCPKCNIELSESIGDGYYRHYSYLKNCECGQKLDWD